MQGLQQTYLLSELYLLHSFNRKFSRLLSAHPIQPLPPEFLDATPLAAQSWETGAVLEGGCPTKVAL
jgi:hypothetical protein